MAVRRFGVNPVKYALAKAMVRHSVKQSDFDPFVAEKNFAVDPMVTEFNNSFFFACLGEDKSAVIMRQAARGNGSFEVWFSVNLPGKGRYSIPAELQEGVTLFDTSPLSLECAEPVNKWRLGFSGDVTGEDGLAVYAEFEAGLTSGYPVFHFTNDADPSPMARSMAAEKWSGRFFRTLQSMHQHHYEQGGTVKGRLALGGTVYPLDMKFIRDHSFGPRNWALMDRHLWICICLRDGRFFNLSLPEYPFIKIRSGFLTIAGGYIPVVDSSSFDSIAYNGRPPSEFRFNADLANGKHIRIICRRGPGFEWLMENVYRDFEWVSDFMVDGVPGTGICEFGYNVKKFNYGTL